MTGTKETKKPIIDTQSASSSHSRLSQPTRPFTIQAKKSNKTGMPNEVLQKMESAFNTDFSNVKITPNSSKPTELGAMAYTQGSNIHFAPGQFNPSTPNGQKIIGHELAHVVQQRKGIVKPTTQAKGLPVNDDSKFEKEADAKGAKAARSAVPQAGNPIQMVIDDPVKLREMAKKNSARLSHPHHGNKNIPKKKLEKMKAQSTQKAVDKTTTQAANSQKKRGEGNK